MDVVEGQAPKPQEIVQGAARGFCDLHSLAKLAPHDLVCLVVLVKASMVEEVCQCEIRYEAPCDNVVEALKRPSRRNLLARAAAFAAVPVKSGRGRMQGRGRYQGRLSCRCLLPWAAARAAG